MGEYGIGQSVPREEDPYLVRGLGRYVDDVTRDRAVARLRAALAARPCAHQVDRHQRRKGHAGRSPRPDRQGRSDHVARHPAPADAAQEARRLARPPARRSPRWRATGCAIVGDFVAFVVADTLEQAKDAAEAIAVDYEMLPAVVEYRGRDQARTRRRCGRTIPATARSSVSAGDKAAIDAAFAKAAHVAQASHGHQPHHHQLDGAARLHRRVRRARRPHHVALHRAGPAHDPPLPGERSPEGSRQQGARHFRKRRRRLRHEGRRSTTNTFSASRRRACSAGR